jgi:hypothetical protein
MRRGVRESVEKQRPGCRSADPVLFAQTLGRVVLAELVAKIGPSMIWLTRVSISPITVLDSSFTPFPFPASHVRHCAAIQAIRAAMSAPPVAKAM